MKIRNLPALTKRRSIRVSILVLATALLALIFRETIGEWAIWLVDNKYESNSAIVRNIVLIFATVVALPLALWRLVVADRQSKIAGQQSNTAKLGLLNERFRHGVEMLVGPQLVERLGGISILEQLAKESVEAHHIQIVELFSMLIRNSPEYKEEDIDTRNEKSVGKSPRSRIPALRTDLQSILCALENRSNEGKTIEKQQNFTFDFSGAKLARAKLRKSDWSSTRLRSAELSNALIVNCVMKKASLFDASLAGANLVKSNLSEAYLLFADLSKSELSEVDLSKAHLDNCKLQGTLLHKVSLRGASLRDADLSGAEIIDADFLDADLTGTNFSGAKLINVKNLTKYQMSQSVGKPDKIPDLPD